MNIDWWTLALQSINALVLIWLLSRFLFTPVARLIAERQQSANELLDEAQSARSVAYEHRQKAEQTLKELSMERGAVIASAGADAAVHRKELLANASIEAQRLIDQSKVELSRYQKQLDIETRKNAMKLALSIVDKLIGRLPNVSRVEGFTDGLIDAVEQLSESDRLSFLQDENPLQLRAAYPLSDQQTATCVQSIKSALGQGVSIIVSEDPTLIAGLELIGTHCAVRNSFRTDLEHIANTLKSDEAAV